MQQYKIQKGIPVGQVRKKKESPLTLTLRKMKRGDSILVKSKKHLAYAYSLQKKLSIAITARKVDCGTSRVWRTC